MAPKVSTEMHGADMVVRVTGETQRAAARNLAMKAAGTVAVGATEGQPGAYTFHVSAKALAARKVVGSTPPARTLKPASKPAPADALAAVLASLDPAVAKVIRAALADGASARDAVKAGAEHGPRAKAPNTFVRDVIARRAEARASVTCATCQDHGKVRASGPRAYGVAAWDGKGVPPWAFRTANGAAGAVGATVPCPSHKKARKTA